jgi:Sulfatase
VHTVNGVLSDLKGWLPDLLVDEGLKFIEGHVDQPFLLSIHFRAPHTPYAPVPEQDSAPYRTLDLGSVANRLASRWALLSMRCSDCGTSIFPRDEKQISGEI